MESGRPQLSSRCCQVKKFQSGSTMADIREPVEITALTKNIPNIIDAVTVVGTLHWFETQLVAKAFIPHQTAQGIIDTQGVPPAQKARQLMESVFAQIRGSSERKRQWFNEFVDIFSHDTAHQGLVERLRREGSSIYPIA